MTFQIKMQRTDENLFKSHYAMMNMKQLTYYRDSVERESEASRKTVFQQIKWQYKVFFAKFPASVQAPQLNAQSADILHQIPEFERGRAYRIASDNIRMTRDLLSSKLIAEVDFADKIRSLVVEYNRKLTLAVSCLVLFFIGAPLGAIIRKGGLGLPVVMSVIFFLFYHIISTIGEKYAKEGDVSPILGMWIAIIVLAPLGAFLTYKASADSVLFDIDLYKKWFKKLLRKTDD